MNTIGKVDTATHEVKEREKQEEEERAMAELRKREKKAIKKKQEYGGLEMKKEIKINPLDHANPTLAIEGNKPLAITGTF